MERNFYTDDFEELLKEKADQYKMYPSDKVWNGIQSSLHSRRKWYWMGFALLLSGVSYYAIEALVAPPRPAQKSNSRLATASSPNISAESNTDKHQTAFVIPLPLAKTPEYLVSTPRPNKPFYGVFNIDRSYSQIEPGATAKLVDMLGLAKITVNGNQTTTSQIASASGAGLRSPNVPGDQLQSNTDNSSTDNSTNDKLSADHFNSNKSTADVLNPVNSSAFNAPRPGNRMADGAGVTGILTTWPRIGGLSL